MSSSEKNNKIKGIAGTIIFHSLLAICFIFMGLTYRIPPPPEEGITINFGFTDEGNQDVQPEDNAVESDPRIEEIIKEVTEIEQEVITQDLVKTEIIEAPKETKKETQKEPEEKQEEIVIEKAEPIVNKKALYTGKKTSPEDSDGNKEYKGNQGSVEGNQNSTEYEGGGIGIDGLAYQLSGRNVSFKAKPIYKIQTQGKVVVEITVDQLGNVISAVSGVKGSTTLDPQLLKRAKEAALKTKFTAKESAPSRQQGKIIYNFQLN